MNDWCLFKDCLPGYFLGSLPLWILDDKQSNCPIFSLPLVSAKQQASSMFVFSPNFGIRKIQWFLPNNLILEILKTLLLRVYSLALLGNEYAISSRQAKLLFSHSYSWLSLLREEEEDGRLAEAKMCSSQNTDRSIPEATFFTYSSPQQHTFKQPPPMKSLCKQA